NIALQEIEVNKAKSLPQLSFGYFNQSITGMQNINGVEKNFTAANRFSAAQIGVNIPIFNGANKAKIAAAKTNYSSTQVEYEESLTQQKSIIEQLKLKYQKNLQALDYF